MGLKYDVNTPTRADDDSTNSGITPQVVIDTVVKDANARSSVTGAPFNNIPYFYNNDKYKI